MNFAGAGTLFRKEILRFWKVAVQALAAPGLTAGLYPSLIHISEPTRPY